MKQSILVFADDWGRHPSSCQHLIRRLVGRYRVLWVNTIGTRSLAPTSFTLRRVQEKLRNWTQRVHRADEDLWVVDVPMLPWIDHPLCRHINRKLVGGYLSRLVRQLEMPNPVVLTTIPHAVWLLGKLAHDGLIYYCTDDYSQWPSARAAALEAAEEELREKAQLVLAVSPELVDRNRTAARCELFPHGVDFDHFSQACRAQEEPLDLRRIPKPRIGFFGLIYEKIDFSLLAHVARQNPGVSLVLLGPVVKCDERLQSLPNVHLLGAQPYEDLPGWIAGLDVLMLPYVRDRMILQSNPLKLRECLATGKPLVSIDLPEAQRFAPLVQVANSPEAFAEAVCEALKQPPSPDAVRSRQAAVEGESWDVRAEKLAAWISELAGTPAERDGRAFRHAQVAGCS